MKTGHRVLATTLLALAACGSEPTPSVDAGAAVADAGVYVSPTAAEWTGACNKLDEASDFVRDPASEAAVVLGGTSVASGSPDVVVAGRTATITAPGSYRLSGTLTDGQIRVEAEGRVRLVLDGAHVTSATGAALEIVQGRTVILLAEGSTNSLTDAPTRPEGAEATAALYSQEELSLGGSGALTVHGRYRDGIAGKDGVLVRAGTFEIEAVDDGLRGKDCLQISDGVLTVRSGGDALKSDEDGDAERGYVQVKGGTLDLEAGGDGISASTSVYVTAGTFHITTGGGSTKTLADGISAKGLRGTAGVVLDGGRFELDTADDAVHSDGVVHVNGGSFEVATGDDGFHSGGAVTLENATIDITRCYEGLEGRTVTLDSGEVRIVASDDGINASDGTGSPEAQVPGPGMGDGGMSGPGPGMGDGGMGPGPGPGPEMGDGGMPGPGPGPMGDGGMGPGPGPGPGMGDGGMGPGPGPGPGMGDGGMPGPGPGPVTPGETNDLAVTINGGRLIISTATGDGIDSNGNLTINGGVVLVTGPTIENNGSLDIGDGQGFGLNVNGGLLVAVASAGMAIAPSDTSTQRSLFVSTQVVGSQPAQSAGPAFPAGTLVHVADGTGKSLLTFRPEQAFASLVFSSPALAAGSYVVSTGGTSSGAVTDGVFAEGTYEGGTARATVTLATGVVATGRWTP